MRSVYYGRRVCRSVRPLIISGQEIGEDVPVPSRNCWSIFWFPYIVHSNSHCICVTDLWSDLTDSFKILSMLILLTELFQSLDYLLFQNLLSSEQLEGPNQRQMKEKKQFPYCSLHCISNIPNLILSMICARTYDYFHFSQILNLLHNGAISKYVVMKHLCGAIIQWWFSYIYCALCCACLYSSSSLWSSNLEAIAVLVCV
jgi:hypothetical protein